MVPGNGEVENWWFSRRPTFGGFGSDEVDAGAAGNVNTSCGGLAPSRLENADRVGVAVGEREAVRAGRGHLGGDTSNSTHWPSVAALLAAICAPVVAGRLF